MSVLSLGVVVVVEVSAVVCVEVAVSISRGRTDVSVLRDGGSKVMGGHVKVRLAQTTGVFNILFCTATEYRVSWENI